MKTLIKKIALACLLLLVASVASAYDFEYEGGYYNIISSTDLTCEITYKEYLKETDTYKGYLLIPLTVEYNGHIYKVVSIGEYAFYGCSNLVGVILYERDSITSIGDYAFFNCSSMTGIIIPEGVISIGDYAFDGCSIMTDVIFSESVTSIGDWAFYNCSSLTSVTIPEGVTSIGDHAFSNSGLTNITIPGSVTSFGNNAFYGCSSLTDVIISEGVTSIGRGAFEHCSNLTDVTISEGVTSIGDYAFFCCSSLKNITIPEGLVSIGNYAFVDCFSLTGITFPESVVSIGDLAFENCTWQDNINIPKSVTYIGKGAFSPCYSANEIIVDDENPYFTSIKGVLYSKDITKIYSYHSGLNETTFTIPETVNSIEAYAFEGASLQNITIPETVTSIGERAFNCFKLTSLVIPSSVTTIGQNAFYGCSGLTELSIPPSVISMYPWPVPSCYSLNSFNIEDGMTPLEIISSYNGLVGNYFRELYIGRSIVIKENSYHDKMLVSTYTEKVTFGQFATSVDYIGMYTAKNLKTVVSYGSIPPTIDDDFFSADQYNNATLNIPQGALQEYKEATGWRNFYNIVESLPTGISNVESATGGMTVTADNGYIVISNANGKVTVYDISGVIINTVNANRDDTRIAVPSHGMYIVKAGGKTVKVAM